MSLEAIESGIRGLGGWGFVAYIGLFVVLTSVFVPDTVLAIVAGLVFGLWTGTVLVVTGALLAAALQYALARRLLRARIEKAVATRPKMRAIRHAVLGQQLRLQVLLRLTPLNPASVSYVLGASGVRASGFLLACLALIPLLFVEVWLGRTGSEVAGAAQAGASSDHAHLVTSAVGLAACLLVGVLVTRAASRALKEAVEQDATSV